MHGWARTTVGQVYDIVGGGTPSTSIPEYWEGEIPWISSADIYDVKDIRPRKKITKKAVEGSATHLVPANSIIVVTRVGLGKLAITKEPLCFSQDSQALIGNPDLVYPEYALNYLSKAVNIFKYQHRGTTIAGVTKKQLSELVFYLPPFNEQRRIVSKIDELFSDLDVGVSSLKKAKAELSRYRQSVLAHAFSGKLTEDWRKTHGNELEPATALLELIRAERRKNPKYKDASPVDSSDLPKLPKGWEWTRFNDFAFVTKLAGFEFTKYVEYKDSGDIPVIRAQNVSKIGFREGNFIFVDREIMEKLPRSRVFGGEILIVFVGAGLGNTGIVPKGREYFLGPNVAKVKIESEDIHNRFMYYFLKSELGKSKVLKFSKSTAQGSISMANIRDVAAPLAPSHEQLKILELIEERFSIIDSIEKTIDSSLFEASRLRQSILKRAFEGKLVPQDPRDEPANILLERIKKEKT
jgi:type I restriction enzyme, S subunit